MLIKGDGIADQIRRLTRMGWLKEGLLLANTALDGRQISQSEHHELVALVRMAEPNGIAASHEVFGLAADSVICSAQFEALTDMGAMRESFRQAVRWVEIETSSQCNRHCSYCPNSRFDRSSGNDFLDSALYARILSDLAEIDFDGEIVFVGNNEILMHDRNFDYLAEARRRLGRAVLVVYSNGDYLNADKLDRLVRSGVDRIGVTLHPGPGKPFDADEVACRAKILAVRTGLDLVRTVEEAGHLIVYAAERAGLEVTVALHNFAISGHNWAGLLPGHEAHVRTDPCSYPLRQFVVDHDGDLFACCLAFKERTEQNLKTGMLTGNLRDFPSIFHAYADQALRDWRRALFTNGAKHGPCRTCTGHFGNQESSFIPLADLVTARLSQREK